MLLFYETHCFTDFTDIHLHIYNERKFRELGSGETFFSWALPF